MADEDREKLIRFLDDLQQVVTEMIDEHSDAFGDLAKQASSAWSELTRNFEETKAILEGREREPSRSLTELLDRLGLRAEALDARLTEVGLTGAQLDFKLAGFNRALAAWRRERAEDRPKGFRALLHWIRGRKRLTRILSIGGNVLKWADVALKSLGSVIPAAEAIQEAKDGVETVLGEAAEGMRYVQQ